MSANSLSNIMPKILARALISLRTRCVMPRLVNSDYGALAAQKGTTIDIPVPVAVSTTNVSVSNTPTDKTGLTPGVVQISLDQWKQNVPIGLTDKDLLEIEASETFLPMQLTEAVKALASDVNQQIIGKYTDTERGIYGVAGSSYGTTPFGSSQGVSGATLARKILNEQLCPNTDRRGVIDFATEANMLDLSQFSDADKIMSAVVKMEGEIGRKYGIDWVADDDVSTHTAGTAKTQVGTYACSNEAVDDASIATVTSNSASDDDKTIVPGDIVTFSGSSAGADTQTYVVIGSSTYTFAGGSGSQTISNLAIYPGLKVAFTGGSVVMDVKPSHVVNMAFHRDAFGFATRPLLDVSRQYSLGSEMVSMQDPVTGLVLRLEVSRQHKQTVWEFDILWGSELVRPDLATRIIGQ